MTAEASRASAAPQAGSLQMDTTSFLKVALQAGSSGTIQLPIVKILRLLRDTGA